MNNFNLNFEGYWRDCNKGGLPTYSEYILYIAADIMSKMILLL